ncbi:hypothetical protein [Ralstonia sp. ASV6]|uniref:hypothetical protein n=1 Tax=Ralstonia sp. ASV6 TaxID=2795124 RepID=UPI0018ED8800|nr:hypothetical protein [Ralstonia sp. ASV6]
MMGTPNLNELAAKPAGDDQIKRAREICGESEVLHAKLDAFLNENPTRGSMVEFMSELKEGGLKAEMEANILRICASVGIDQPTGTDRLLALQIGLLQEQNEALANLARRTGQIAHQTKESPSIFGPVLAAVLIGKVL